MVVTLPILCDLTTLLSTSLVIEDMEVDLEATVAETTHNGGGILEPMFVLKCFEWTHKNVIAISVVSNHYILVSNA